MTRIEFFKICDGADQKYAHQLGVAEIYNQRDLAYVIEVSGSSWCQGGLIHYEIYRPKTQGRGDQPFATARAAIAKELPKYKRWLMQWKIDNGVENGPKGSKWDGLT